MPVDFRLVFQAPVGKSTNLTSEVKSNYLTCFLGDALRAIAGFSLANDNYKEELELLHIR